MKTNEDATHHCQKSMSGKAIQLATNFISQELMDIHGVSLSLEDNLVIIKTTTSTGTFAPEYLELSEDVECNIRGMARRIADYLINHIDISIADRDIMNEAITIALSSVSIERKAEWVLNLYIENINKGISVNTKYGNVLVCMNTVNGEDRDEILSEFVDNLTIAMFALVSGTSVEDGTFKQRKSRKDF